MLVSGIQQSDSVTDIYTYVYICMESKKMIQMNLLTKQKWTHRHRKQTYGYQRGKVGRDKLGAWD